MRFRQTRLVIGLSVRGVEILAPRGGRAVRPLPPGFALDDELADATLLDAPLAEALAEVGVRRAAGAVLVYDSPTSVVDLARVPGRGEPARQAARLGVLDALTSADAGSAADAVQILPPDAGDPAGLMLAAAEQGLVIETLRAWLERSGVAVEGLVPARAITAAAGAAALPIDEGQEAVILHVGAESSLIAACTGDGRVDLIRPMGLGYEHIVDAAHRATAPEPGEAPRLSRERTLEILFQEGLPRPDDAATGEIDPRAVLPGVQPVLQRLAVEAKQTLRFGLPEGRRSPRRILLTGPGARMGRLDEILSVALSVDVVPTPGPIPGGGELAATAAAEFVRLGGPGLRIVPDEVTARRGRIVVRRGIQVGVMVAIAALVGEGVRAQRQRDAAEQRLLAQDAALERIADHRRTQEQASELAARVRRAEAAAESVFGVRPDWQAALAELALACEGAVELTEVSGLYERGQGAIVVRGLAVAGEDGTDRLGVLIERLRRSPLIADVRLEGKQVSDKAASGAAFGREQFELRLTPVGLRTPGVAVVDAAREGTR